MNNYEMVQNLKMTFSKVAFILAFAISFSARTFQLQSMSGLVFSEQNCLKTNANFVFVGFLR